MANPPKRHDSEIAVAARSILADSLNRLSVIVVMVLITFGFFWLVTWPLLALFGGLSGHFGFAALFTGFYLLVPLTKKVLTGKPIPRWQDLERGGSLRD